MSILWNGDVVPCCSDLGGKHIMGNAFKDGLMNVWNNKKYKVLRKATHCVGCEIYRYKFLLEDDTYKYTKRSD
jgi:radical SAM protein with 4Fe4S-binding SPASM domain